jgi:hypothetical protein
MNTKYAFTTVDRIQPNLPNFLEKIDKNWVLYGLDNLYPNFLVTLYDKSAIHKTAINSKLDAIIGQGLSFEDETNNYLIKRANQTESWNDVFEKMSLDYLIFSGFAINVIWSNDGETIAEFHHLDFSKVRSGSINPETDKVETYFYSSDWTNIRKFKPTSYIAYDKSKAKENPSQILYFFNYSPGTLYYPLPDYSGGINDIQTDIEVSKFHISNLANGLVPGLIISLNNGVPSTDLERQEVYDEITSAYRGSENAGKLMLLFNTDAEHAADIHTVESPNDSYYIELEKRITSRILTAHRITSPLLLGLYSEGGNGFSSSADEIEVAYEHFISTVIRPIQKAMLKVFNQLLYDKGTQDKELRIIPNTIVSANSITEAIE